MKMLLVERSPTRAAAPIVAMAIVTASCGGARVFSGPPGDGGGGATPVADAAATTDGGGGPSFGLDGSLADSSSGVVPPTSSCGPYEAMCNGACIATSTDPSNCGACGNVCAANQACSAGVCSTGCTATTVGGSAQVIKCGQTCVDPWTDNKNCGACGNDCTASGKVCAGGACATSALALDAGARACPGGGPVITVPLGTGGSETCTGLLAQTTFRWGMCACGDVSLVSSGQSWAPTHPGLDVPALYVDAYDSTKGPWDPNSPEIGGSVGVNGTLTSATGASTFVTGSLWCSSSIDVNGRTDVKEELHAVGPVTAGDVFDVGEPNSSTTQIAVVPGTATWSGYVRGNITGATSAPATFFGDLYVPAAGSARSAVTVKGAVKTSTPDFTVPPPCDSCGSAAIPVGAIVDARSARNDDASIGLSPSAMASLTGSTRLDLPCGSFYLDAIQASGSVTVYAHGHTALFVAGDAVASVLTFSVDPGGSFDVFVKGTIKASGDLVVGNPNYAALTRVYLGAPGLTLSGETHIAGLFYAAASDIDLGAHITSYGALYCNRFVGQGDNTDIHYDRSALHQGDPCVPPTQCKTCGDCGNQACIAGRCGACQTSADCCAPLLCVAGSCQAAAPPR
jgi:hypothetical protein